MKKFLAISLLVLLFVSCGQNKSTEEKTSAPVNVEVLKVRSHADASDVSYHYIGTAEAVREVTLLSRHSGTLKELSAHKGDRVNKGQSIAVVESQSVKSSLEMAEASLKQAEDAYERAGKVHADGGVADVKMVEIETKLNQSRAAAEAAREALKECTIKAPFDGFITEVYVSGADEELSTLNRIAKLTDPGEVEVRFAVPENEIGNIRKGDKAVIEVAAIKGGETFEGEVKSTGINASPLSHSYDCTVSVRQRTGGTSGNGRLLLPGMVCKVRMAGSKSTEDKKGGFIVPSEAVQTGTNGRYVWIAGEDGIVEKRSITTGGFAGKGVLVSSGLKEGDAVIVKGFRKVSSGMKVHSTEGLESL